MGGIMSTIGRKLLGKRELDPTMRQPLLNNNRSRQRGVRAAQGGPPARPSIGVSSQVVNSSSGKAVGPDGLSTRVSNKVVNSRTVQGGPAIRNQNMSSPPIQPIQQSNSQVRSTEQQNIRHKMNVYCFKKSRNIIQIHQRHATTCANVLNKGFDASKSDINNLAPNTSLTAIGIQQCMQLSDFLLFCKSKNVNYITSQDYTTIDDLNLKLEKTQYYYISEEDLKKKLGNIEDPQNLISRSYTGNKTRIEKLKLETLLSLLKKSNILKTIPTIKNQQQSQQQPQLQLHELNQKKELRPMLIFCCSELLRTQQTLFITYFDIIKDYLKNRRKIIVLFWLNEQHVSKMTNADNFVLTLAHTKLQWKYFIKRIKNLEFDKTFMKNIGREIEHDDLVEFSKKLNLEEQLHTSTAFSGKKINYEEWEDIFYVSPHIYQIQDPKDRLPENFSFDNRKFSSSHRIMFRTGFGKKMYDPKELYKELPTILSMYILHSTIMTHDSDYGVDFYEERIGPDVKMNLVFVSHHNSGENTMKYLTSDDSEAVFHKQQLMNCELVILPKGGILGKKEYMTEFGGVNEEKEYKDAVEKQLDKEKKNKQINSNLRAPITSYLDDKLNQKSHYNYKYNDAIYLFENARINLLNELYTEQYSVSDNVNYKRIISSIENIIMYFKYLRNYYLHIKFLQGKTEINISNPISEFTFTLKNRIFPVGFYDTIYQSTIGRKNKSGQHKQIYPLFILYNSLLGIFFTPLDIIKQEVAIIPPSANSKTGIEESSQTFSLSFPLEKFLNMTYDEYITFLDKSEKILMGIIKDYYNQERSSNQHQPQAQDGVASTAVPVVGNKGNEYFYNYEQLLKLVIIHKTGAFAYNERKKKEFEESVKKKNKNINNLNVIEDTKIIKKSYVLRKFKRTILQGLREKYDTKTLVHHFGNCLFDFCAITDPARNRLRQIVIEKLKLEVGEKNYKQPFKLEVKRHLQKFIDDYEKVSGKVKNESIREEVIPISKGLFSSKKKSKSQILNDINSIDKTPKNRQINSNGNFIFDNMLSYFKRVANIYKEYNIIDSSAYSKIDSLSNEYKRRYDSELSLSTINKNKLKIISDEYALKIMEIFRPFQKKFLDSIINRDIRHRNDQKNESIKDKTKKTVNIMNTPPKKSRYIVIENEQSKLPLNYIKYKNIPIVKSR